MYLKIFSSFQIRFQPESEVNHPLRLALFRILIQLVLTLVIEHRSVHSRNIHKTNIYFLKTELSKQIKLSQTYVLITKIHVWHIYSKLNVHFKTIIKYHISYLLVVAPLPVKLEVTKLILLIFE